MENRKLNIQIDDVLASRWTSLKSRFNYKTNVKLLDDLIYFFETNPVNPKQNFTSLLNNLENKIDEFHKDNNRVIAVLRNIEKVKIDPMHRGLMTNITSDLRDIKNKIMFNEVIIPNDKIEEQSSVLDEKNTQVTTENNVDKLTESYEKKLKSERERYKMLQIEYDKVTLEHGAFYNRLKKLNSLFTIEKSTFGKSKIVFEMTEEEFKELIKLK